jgi:hypothetical protein
VWKPYRAGRGVVVTEGALKGLITAHHLDICVLAVAGVANWRAVRRRDGTFGQSGVLDLLAHAPPHLVVTIAFDADAMQKPEVWRAQEELAAALWAKGYCVQVATWPTEHKGIDDALLAGATIDVRPWRPGIGPPQRPHRSVALGAVTRPVGVPLGTTR